MAIPYVKQTWTASSPPGISAARLGVIEQGVTDAHLMPGASAYTATGTAETDGIWITVALDSERFDQVSGGGGTQHDTVTNNSRLTCLYAGKYQIWATVTGGVNSGHSPGGVRVLYNGATVIGGKLGMLTTTVDYASNLTTTTLYDLAVSDYVEVQAFGMNGSGTKSYGSLGWIRVA